MYNVTDIKQSHVVISKGVRIMWRTPQHVWLLVCSLFTGTLARGWAWHCDPAGGSGRAKPTARRVTTAVVLQGTRVALLIKSCHSHFTLINEHLLSCFIYTLLHDPWPRQRQRPQTALCVKREIKTTLHQTPGKGHKSTGSNGNYFLWSYCIGVTDYYLDVSVFISVMYSIFYYDGCIVKGEF